MKAGIAGAVLLAAGVAIACLIAWTGIGIATDFVLGFAAAFALLGGSVLLGHALARPAGRAAGHAVPAACGDDDTSDGGCPVCGGEPRRSDRTIRCTCTENCGNRACVGDYTTLSTDWYAQVRAMLAAEGGDRA